MTPTRPATTERPPHPGRARGRAVVFAVAALAAVAGLTVASTRHQVRLTLVNRLGAGPAHLKSSVFQLEAVLGE